MTLCTNVDCGLNHQLGGRNLCLAAEIFELSRPYPKNEKILDENQGYRERVRDTMVEGLMEKPIAHHCDRPDGLRDHFRAALDQDLNL